MPYQTLISSGDLLKHLSDPAWVVVDCRFSLDDTERGGQDYERAHIPGAVYAHLDHDLSGPPIPGATGRHPLPAIEDLARTLSTWGIGHGIQVVCYDDKMGSIAAARLWWLLRWAGHDTVAVLDGGWADWQAHDYPTRQGTERRAPASFVPHPRPELVAESPMVLAASHDQVFRVADARATERYTGDHEPIDPVAGHIPGAISLPFSQNLGADGHFLSLEDLRARFHAVFDDTSPEHTIFYCGSGVTAAHNVLAYAHAGLGDARMYPGSWSEWITDPLRPIEKGLPTSTRG